MTNNRLKTFVFTYDYKVTAHTLKEANESRQYDDGFYVRPSELTYHQVLIPTSEEVLDYLDMTRCDGCYGLGKIHNTGCKKNSFSICGKCKGSGNN